MPLVALFTVCDPASAYIDPGSGLPFFSSLGYVIGILVAFFTGIFWFVRRHVLVLITKVFKIWYLVLGSLAVIGLGIFIFMRISSPSPESAHNPKLIIIGMDGIDPALLEKYIGEGELPHFSRLSETGAYRRMSTVNPPQSPVAWSSFATGLNPGKHGIFDFIMRDPETYLPYLALNEIVPPKKFSLGKLEIPLGPPRALNRRKGTPFWSVTSRAGIPTSILLCPATFPPDTVTGEMLSGMGVPDLRGTEGTFSFYTTENPKEGKETGGEVFHIRFHDSQAEAVLPGPRDSADPSRSLSLPLSISIASDSATIKIAKKEITVTQNEWSPWIRITFSQGLFMRFHGIVRFYLKQLAPEFELYASPVNFDPYRPPFPISHPENFSRKLADEIGLYYTQGEPYDTWALNEGRLDDEAFLQQVRILSAEREKMFHRELNRFRDGILFFYFQMPDVIQHTFWRLIDPDHPLHHPGEAGTYGKVILECYQQMDQIVARTLDQIDDETIVIILSDHGFNTFRRAVHINSWLRDNGFLTLHRARNPEGRELFQDVDWSLTRAYATGFGGIYVNQRGRERNGIVSPGEDTEEIKNAIISGLAGLRDQETHPVRKVYRREEIFWGPYIDTAPDLFVGFYPGYRASWQTALGACPLPVIEDNLKKWSGDHLFDPDTVPAIFFMNRKLDHDCQPSILDIAPTVIDLFNLEYPEEIDGKSLREYMSP